MKKIVMALRHGERADRHPTARVNLIKYDPCLTEKGLVQAQQSAERIKRLVPGYCSVHVVSSPFLRTIETAAFVAKAFGVSVHVDKGFGEVLLSCDFSSNPMGTLKFFSRREEIERDVGCQIVENRHLVEAGFPETFEQGYSRVKRNWEEYFPRVREDVCIVVSHLYVVAGLSEAWLKTDFQEFEESYCKLTMATFDGSKYSVQLLCDHSHATQ